jgi:hypothetical protein
MLIKQGIISILGFLILSLPYLGIWPFKICSQIDFNCFYLPEATIISYYK